MQNDPHSQIRPRRLRAHPRVREMLARTHVAPVDLIAPLFVRSGKGVKSPLNSMPGVHQYSVDTALVEIKRLDSLGVGGFILFGVTDAERKDVTGSYALNPDNEVCLTLKAAKDAGVGMVAITDLCFCEYTSHGHCGSLAANRASVDNDLTVEALGRQAANHARAGADIVAPSGMMDNMVAGIRSALDHGGFSSTAILSYAVKYASSFYGPFREAAESPPQFGDRKSYQMDFRRGVEEALREAAIDVAQGADMVMVKPGIAYLDILRAVSAASPVPTAVYQVSGEYSMLKAAAANGWIDEKAVVLETMHAFRRAGGGPILTYYAGELAGWLG